MSKKKTYPTCCEARGAITNLFNMLEVMTKIHEAVDILFGKGITTPEYLIEEFEAIHRAFAYNHIWAEQSGDAKMGARQACDALYNLEALIDGLKGKHLN